MKRIRFVLAAVLLCLIFAVQSQATPYLGLYNTGVDNTGAVLSDGTIGDPHYTLVSFPTIGGGAAWSSTSTIMIRTSASGFPIPPWIGDDSLSTWIGPDNSHDLNGPVGLYDYRTTFNVPAGINLSRLQIIGGEVSADNQQAGILLNGNLVVPANTSNGPAPYTQFTQFFPFNITSGFVAGKANTLDFLVYNNDYNPSNPTGDNPTGLRVEMTASTTRGVIPGLFNTGVNSSGVPLPDGTVGDPHYTLAGPSQTQTPPPSTPVISTLVRTSVSGWPIPPYIGDDNVSAWIGPAGVNDLNGPAGYYSYTTHFNLTGFVPGSATITGLWAADNQEVAIYLNGTDGAHLVVPMNTGYLEPDGYNEQFTNWSPFTITSNLFQPGDNTLTFEVLNQPYNPPSSNDNPTALRVELFGTADYSTLAGTIVPEPLSMIFFGTGLIGVGGYVARRRMQARAYRKNSKGEDA